MDVQDATLQNVQVEPEIARRFYTGTEQSAISYLSLDDKLDHMLQKLNNLEQSNQVIVSISQCASNVPTRVNSLQKRSTNQALFIK